MSDYNRHTCEKAAAEWQKEGPCAECEYERNRDETFRIIFGEPLANVLNA